MDPLHAKIGADLLLGKGSKEEDFYQHHGCDWLHFIKSMIRKTNHAKPRKHPKSIWGEKPIEH